MNDEKLRKFLKIAMPVGLILTAIWVVIFVIMVATGIVRF